MKDEGKAALGRVVLAHREHILAIEPLGKGMLANTLHYDYEMRDEKDYFSGIRSVRADREMVTLAKHILDSKASRFDPSKFKDRYETALRAMVKRKAKGHTIEAAEEEPAESGNVIDLFEALKQSLGRKGADSSPRKRSAPRRAAKKKTKRRKAA